MMQIQDGAELCFSQLLNSSCTKPTLHWSKAVFMNVVVLFISLVTVALNLLIIISVSHFRQLHTPTNIILLSLAFSDFIVGLLVMPLELMRNTSCWLLGDVLCIVCIYLMSLLLYASVGNIVLISVDRYMAVCDPLHYPTKITLSRFRYCICLCWLWSGLYSIVYLKDDLIQPGRSNSCFGECMITINYIFGTIDLVLNFIFPVTVIVVLYMRVFVVAVSQARAMRSHIKVSEKQHSVKLKARKSELKAARTLGILVIVYLICLCPYYCYSLIEGNFSGTASFYFVFLYYFNSCLNPIIYALFYPWFRKSSKLIITLQILQPGSRESKILS